MDVIGGLLNLFSLWWIWLPIVLALLYLTYQNQRRIKHIDSIEHVVLILEIPRSNDKKEPSAEQMFASLHGMLRSKKELIAAGDLQEHLSFEIAAHEQSIRFYLWVPKHLQNFVESQIYTQYPNLQIQEAPQDYTNESLEGKVFHSAELRLSDNQALPIKTYTSFEADPLTAITNTLAKLDKPEEAYWIQVMTRPADGRWQQRSSAFVRRLRSGQKLTFDMTSVISGIFSLATALSKPPQASYSATDTTISEKDRAKAEAADKKATKPGFQVKIRLAYIGTDENTARMRLQTLIGAFKQFNAPHTNNFIRKKGAQSGTEGLANYRARFFIDKGFILNTEELASLFHLPYGAEGGTQIAWAKTKSTEPPSELPTITGDHVQDSDISAFATTNYRGLSQQFGLLRSDRDRHVYILGQTGVGKSKLLELFALSDLYHNQGYAIIDPHGDFAINNLYFVPPGRMKDVIYFNPADTAYPIGFNPMELSDPAFKGRVSAELVHVLKYLFGATWNTRLEYMLRYIILALLETPGTTMLDITRMLTDTAFREAIVANVSDPVVRSFWVNEFQSWNETFAGETVSPILNKVGSFTANPIIRNIIGQQKSTFNLRQVMDEGKIFVANLSGGLLGEESAALLGSLLITKIQQAAMSRVDPNTRRPFYLYVDEFQNFATDSFVPILSEARKYGLSLTMANQYIGQMSPLVRDAVFGNVGTMVTFRVSPDDAQLLDSFFSPRFEAHDLTELHNRNFAIAMTIRGEKTPPFTGTTLALPSAEQNYLAEIIANTRSHYSSPQSQVEQALLQAATPTAQTTPTAQPQDKPFVTSKNESRTYAFKDAQGSVSPSPQIGTTTPQVVPIEPEQEHIFRIRHK